MPEIKFKLAENSEARIMMEREKVSFPLSIEDKLTGETHKFPMVVCVEGHVINVVRRGGKPINHLERAKLLITFGFELFDKGDYVASARCYTEARHHLELLPAGKVDGWLTKARRQIDRCVIEYDKITLGRSSIFANMYYRPFERKRT